MQLNPSQLNAMGLTAPLFHETFRSCVEKRHESSSDCAYKAIRSQMEIIRAISDEQAQALNIPIAPVRAFMAIHVYVAFMTVPTH